MRRVTDLRCRESDRPRDRAALLAKAGDALRVVPVRTALEERECGVRQLSHAVERRQRYRRELGQPVPSRGRRRRKLREQGKLAVLTGFDRDGLLRARRGEAVDVHEERGASALELDRPVRRGELLLTLEP